MNEVMLKKESETVYAEHSAFLAEADPKEKEIIELFPGCRVLLLRYRAALEKAANIAAFHEYNVGYCVGAKIAVEHLALASEDE